MGLLGLLGKVGHGIGSGIDYEALNSLAPGLLGNALAPAMPTSGLLASQPQVPSRPYDPSQSNNDDDNPSQPAPMQMQQPQQQQGKFVPTPQQKHELRNQWLMSVLGGVVSGNLGQSLEHYQDRAVAQIQASQQATAAQNRQQYIGRMQQALFAAKGDTQAQLQIVMQAAPILGAQEAGAYSKLIKETMPEKDDVMGEPFPGVGPDGKPALLQHTKTGRIIPVSGYAPPAPKIESLGNQVMFDPANGRTSPHTVNINGTPTSVVLDSRKQRYELLNGDVVPQDAQITPYSVDKEPKLDDKERFVQTFLKDNSLPDNSANRQTAYAKYARANQPPMQAPALTPEALNLLSGLALQGGVVPSFGSRGGQAVADIYNKAGATQPDASLAGAKQDFHSQQETLTAFNKGKEAQSVNAINTVSGHLSTLAQAAQALGGGDITVLNRLANAVGAQTGSQPLAVYKTIVNRIGPEITKAYVGTGGEASDRKANENDFDPSLGVPRIMANIGVTSNLFQTKMAGLANQFTKGTGRPFTGYITPEAQATFSRFAPRPQQGQRPPLASFFTGGR